MNIMLEFSKRCCHGLLAFAMLALTGTAVAATIQSIEFSSLPGDKTEIRLTFDGVPPEPTGYTIEQPARIVLDMPGVLSGLDEKHHNLGIGNARRVSIISTKDRTRAIVNLTQLVSYETEIRGNTLYLLVGADSASGMPSQREVASTDDAGTIQRTVVNSEILDVDFRRGEKGDGRIILKLSNPKVPVNVAGDGDRIRVEIRNTILPKNLQRRLDVSDFATPVQIVDAVQEGSNVVLTIRAVGDFDYLAYQADDTLTVNVNPLTEQEVELRQDMFRFTGEMLSLNFQDIEVRSVLQLIADFTDLNLVASDTVTGRITLRLKNVPWDQALDLILRTKGLDKRQDGNVLLVAPAAEIAAREKLQLENQKQIAELAPLRTEFIQIRYASATELFELFNNAGSESGDQSMLSNRGSVIVDERTNSIILTDTAARLDEFRRVIAQLDVPVRQVLIEARIVTANANFSQELGIRWGGGALKSAGIPAVWKAGGSLNTLNELQDIILDPLGQGSISSPGDLVVDL
ncbi:MAG: secretin and TonB N-terminal domain-containing protein, partial [Gammaproteobacteria bacterium]|nr:secretin and TonB N-terminal domain-containing protein [Gammaproteobacteria bacterium]